MYQEHMQRPQYIQQAQHEVMLLIWCQVQRICKGAHNIRNGSLYGVMLNTCFFTMMFS